MSRQNFIELASAVLGPLNKLYESNAIRNEFRHGIDNRRIVFIREGEGSNWQDYVIVWALVHALEIKRNSKIKFKLEWGTIEKHEQEWFIDYVIRPTLNALTAAATLYIQHLIDTDQVDIEKVKTGLEMYLV